MLEGELTMITITWYEGIIGLFYVIAVLLTAVLLKIYAYNCLNEVV